MKQNTTELQLFQKEIEKGTEMAIRHIQTAVRKQVGQHVCAHAYMGGRRALDVSSSFTNKILMYTPF